MPTLDDYATWIIENKDKKGTPEFDTVAAAWQELRDATPTSTLPPPATRELGLLDTLGGGVSRGMSRLGSTFTDVIPAMVGSAIGEEEYAEEQLAEAAEKQRVSELLNPTQFASYKDVEGIGDFTRFAAETIGEQFGNLGLTLGAALTGGLHSVPTHLMLLKCLKTSIAKQGKQRQVQPYYLVQGLRHSIQCYLLP